MPDQRRDPDHVSWTDIIAVGSKADVSFVLAVQTLRLFVVLLTGPLLAKWIARGAPADR